MRTGGGDGRGAPAGSDPTARLKPEAAATVARVDQCVSIGKSCSTQAEGSALRIDLR